MSDSYFNTDIATSVRLTGTTKLYRISKRSGTPYITYKRKTRVLFANPIGGAYINVEGVRVFFV